MEYEITRQSVRSRHLTEVYHLLHDRGSNL